MSSPNRFAPPSGFQLAAAFAGWLGGEIIDGPLGPRAIYPVAALLTAAGLAIALYCLRRDRRPSPGVLSWPVHSPRAPRS